MKNETYGLIGKKLTHSFSKEYFSKKFQREQPACKKYELFEIDNIEDLKKVLHLNPDLKGLNVTIPYKTEVIPLLDEIDTIGLKTGAVNVIKICKSGLIGYNSDYYGFKQSLSKWIPRSELRTSKCLILGTGGASKAVQAVMDDLGVVNKLVSRTAGKESMSYDELNEEALIAFKIIVNTTPLGMYPDITGLPPIPYASLTPSHWLYDLIYNPGETNFMLKGAEKGAQTKNGLEMLYLQAEKSWEIWNS